MKKETGRKGWGSDSGGRREVSMCRSIYYSPAPSTSHSTYSLTPSSLQSLTPALQQVQVHPIHSPTPSLTGHSRSPIHPLPPSLIQ